MDTDTIILLFNLIFTTLVYLLIPLIIKIVKKDTLTSDSALVITTFNVGIIYILFSIYKYITNYSLANIFPPIIFGVISYNILKGSSKFKNNDVSNVVGRNNFIEEANNHSKYVVPAIAMIFLAVFIPILGALILLVGYAMTDKNDVEDKILGKIALKIALIYIIVILSFSLAMMLYFIFV